jgi:5-(hydroxymethyl)furfural/furfural oxidase
VPLGLATGRSRCPTSSDARLTVPINIDLEYDAIIAGAGPAGCVLASRLAEDESKRILLIEAGRDMAPGTEHPDILDPFALSASSNPAFHWPGLVAECGVDPGDGSPRATIPYLQACCVGGASNINGMAVDRGQPGDYDYWQSLGASDWSWDNVLPYFRKLEQDLDFAGLNAPMHNRDGPMPVWRIPRAQLAPFTAAVGDALIHRGFPWIDDYSADFREGLSSVPTNCRMNRRVSASMAYLTREVRQRKNLTILANAKVQCLRLVGRRASGAVVRINGAEVVIGAKQVIVSCGALQSPALLMRSGIGPSEHLVAHGIKVVRDLSGVGSNLRNHPVLALTTYLPQVATQPRTNVQLMQNWLRFSSHHAGCEQKDMHLMVFNKLAWHKLGSRVGAIAVSVLNSYSQGTVRLSDGDNPTIQFNLLDDSRDSDRLIAGLRLALELLSDEGVQRHRCEVFIPNSDLVASLSPYSMWNQLKAEGITWALDRGPLRRRLLATAIIDPDELRQDTEAMRKFVRRYAFMQYHLCGTCRMGAADDPAAVVDGAGRVHGVDALRVVDASILPTTPRGYPHFIVIMAAEKIADSVKAEWGSRNAGMQCEPALH